MLIGQVGGVRIETPDADLDNFVNNWLPRQVFYHGDVNRLSTDPQTRNYLQDNMGMSFIKPSVMRKAFRVILPAAAPTIMTGMRISIGIAWLVIVAAEMLVGGTGIGYFVWNEWNNLSITNILTAILLIGVVGMLLDLCFARLQKLVTYVD